MILSHLKSDSGDLPNFQEPKITEAHDSWKIMNSNMKLSNIQ